MTKIKLVFVFKVIAIFLSGVICGNFLNSKSSIYTSDAELSTLQDSVINEMVCLNIKYPHIVLAQAQIESNNFKSRLFRRNKNMFGMKVAKSRPTCAQRSANGYAFYDTWRESIIDYAFYQSSFLRNKSESDYIAALAASYASDTTYASKIRHLSKSNKKYFKK